MPAPDLFAEVDAQRQRRAADAEREVLAAGFRPRPVAASSRSGSGFESGGVLDTSEPGPVLAGLTDAATRDGRLAELFDDELIGVIRAWRRIESWSSGGLMMAIAELARRRPAERTPAAPPAEFPARPPATPPGEVPAPAPAAPPGEFPARLSEFISDEVAAALTLSARTAAAYVDLAVDLATRLPATAQALRAGVIDYLKARFIAEATRVLADADARAVEARILPAAGKQTMGQLRAAVSRAVLAVDPEAATRRREAAQKDPRVQRWQEDAGTAALAGFGLPPADVLAADQRITARALALRDAGLSGPLEELRARAYLDTLLGQDSTPSLGQDSTPPPANESAQPPPADPAQPPPAGPGPSTGPRSPRSRTPRRLAIRANLTIPLTTLLGLANAPGHIAGFGPLDAQLARDLAVLGASHPESRYCLTVTDDAGQPLGHGCARGRLPSLGPSSGQPPPPRPGPFTVTITPLARGSCDHRHEEAGYQPSRSLRHLIWTRNPTCCAPGCRRPAAQCDLDHTVPYDQGGRTCECDLAPLCRHHHRCKQSPGWQLNQPSPGTLIWTTPAGRQYTTTRSD